MWCHADILHLTVATLSEKFFLLTVLKQGSYGSWKTWKVMEFKNVISRPVKSWNLVVGPSKSWKIKVLFDRFFAADGNARTM